MGRRKIEIKAIKDDRNRSVTFLKRKGGLFKKAHELSVLTSVDVAVIIFGQNNKLYEYSSTSNLPDLLQRYQYARNAYGGPHELKGPDDYKDKGDRDDDDDDDDIDMHEASHSPPQQAMMPGHPMSHPQFQNLGGTPSASPPIPSGAFHHHHHAHSHGTPQPISRPNSRAHIRHPSVNSNIPPGQHMHQQSQQPSYAYQPNPPIYNPQAAAAMQARPQPPTSQYAQYTSVPQSHQTHQAHQSHQTHQQHQQHQPHPNQIYQPEPPRPVPAAQMPQRPQTRSPPQPHQQLAPPQIHEPSPEMQQSEFNSPPLPQPKPLPTSKISTIFTPIDDNRSLLVRHWGGSDSDTPLKPDGSKSEMNRSQSLDVNSIKSRQSNGLHPNGIPAAPTSNPPSKSSSVPIPSSNVGLPPNRQNSLAKPKLKVQIPFESSEDEKTGGGEESASGSRNSGTSNSNILTPIREPGMTPGPVLPPPSPSASALLSDGASGPPNPFARPLPPSTNGNNNGNNNRDRDMDTPISALPSRFMENGMLPSPSSFLPEWDFRGGGGAGNGNMLPSPLNFATPVNPTGPSFKDEDSKKRLGDTPDAAAAKRIKT